MEKYTYEVGTKVKIWGAFGHRSTGEVARTTKTQVILTDGSRYRIDKQNGIGHSGSFNWSCIKPIDADN